MAGYELSSNGVFHGDVVAGDGDVVKAKSPDGAQQVWMYHTGAFGQVESSTGFVLYSDNGSAAVVGTVDPELKVQYGGGSFNSVNVHHDDTNGKITTTAGNLQLNPAGAVVVKNGTVPATATAAGVPGQIAWDASFLYLCVATNTWRRIAHATW